MYIKRIDIIGFKSFADKVSLHFEPGITALLGPNGCGKSNVVDAMRWVMGENNPRSLRGQGMQDVIFNGSQQKRGSGMAEVTMALKLTEEDAAWHGYSEVEVSRRYFRDGSNEYRLNKEPCRRLDVQELFMDTGAGPRAYAVIEQGRVEFLLKARPEERRQIVDEAAGVARFKHRRRKALQKLESAQSNLQRLEDLLADTCEQSEEIAAAAQRAREYKEYEDRFRQLDMGLAWRHCQRLQQSQQAAEQKWSQISQACQQAEQRLQQLELQEQQQQLAWQQQEEKLRRQRRKLHSLQEQYQQAQQELDKASHQQAALQREQQHLAEEVDENRSKLAALAAEKQTLQEQLDQTSPTNSQLQGELQAWQKSLEHNQKRQQQAVYLQRQRQEQIYAVQNELSQSRHRSQTAQQQLNQLKKRQAKQQQQQQELAAKREQAAQQQQGLHSDVAEVETGIERTQQQLKRVQHNQEKATREADTYQTKLQEATTRQREVQTEEKVLSQQRDKRLAQHSLPSLPDILDVLPPLSQQLEVAPGWEQVVEAVLGESLAWPLVRGQRWQDMEALLNAARQGFNCLWAGPFPAGSKPCHAGGDSLPDLPSLQKYVQCPPWLEPLVERLLNSVKIISDFAELQGTAELPAMVTVVTPQGTLVTGRGCIQTGEPGQQEQGLLVQQRRLEELAQQRYQLEQQIASLEQNHHFYQKQLAGLQGEKADLEKQQQQQQQQWQRLQQQLSGMQQRQQAQEEQWQLLQTEAEQLQQEIAGCEQQIAEEAPRQSHLTDRQQQLQAQLVRVDKWADMYSKQVQKHQQHVESLRQELFKQEQQIHYLQQRQQDLEKRYQQDASRNEQIEKRQQQIEEQQQQYRQQQEQARQRQEGLENALKEVQAEVHKSQQQEHRQREQQEQLQQQLKEQRTRLRRLQQQEQQLATHEVELRQKYASDQEHYRDKYKDHWDKLTEDPLGEMAEEGALAEKSSCQTRMQALEPVDLTAMATHAKLLERQEFLGQQKSDLEGSLQGLREALERIDEQTRARFEEAFHAINAQFQQVFPRLFGGGQARLELTDPEDMLQSGIRIEASPPGKSLQNVDLLSGGEKALTAIALLFALYLVKPAPFCVLDEVDAPLDEANVARFIGLVEELSQHSQFLLVTHNKSTMEVAGTLYGVTMPQPGVSQLVSVDLTSLATV